MIMTICTPYRRWPRAGRLTMPCGSLRLSRSALPGAAVASTWCRISTGSKGASQRACLLICDCAPDVLYPARVLDLVTGKVRSCGSCRWERRLEKLASAPGAGSVRRSRRRA